jgi:streptogramin lyase
VNPRDLSAIERIQLGGRAPGELEHALVALGGGSLWVSEFGPPAVTCWGLRTHRLVRRYELSPRAFPVEITYGEGGAWVPDFEGDELLHSDGATGAMSEIEIGPGPTNPAVGFGSVWVTSTDQGTVWRLDAFTERVARVIPVGDVAYGTTVGAGSVWVTDYCRGTVVRIDPRTNEIVARIETGFIPRWLAFGAGHVWVGVAEEDKFGFLSSPGCQGSRSGATATS